MGNCISIFTLPFRVGRHQSTVCKIQYIYIFSKSSETALRTQTFLPTAMPEWINFSLIFCTVYLNTYMGVSKNNGTPKSSHFNRVFHYKSSILGYHHFLETPIYIPPIGSVIWVTILRFNALDIKEQGIWPSGVGGVWSSSGWVCIRKFITVSKKGGVDYNPNIMVIHWGIYIYR